jgi:2-dehydro-3-deoxy-D-gluconate 5-dehydrogenase
MDVNLKAPFLLCRPAGRHMVPLRRGKIINIASLNSFICGDQVAPYTASKGGVSQLTKALSNEWVRHNVQVNALAPGFITTDM